MQACMMHRPERPLLAGYLRRHGHREQLPRGARADVAGAGGGHVLCLRLLPGQDDRGERRLRTGPHPFLLHRLLDGGPAARRLQVCRLRLLHGAVPAGRRQPGAGSQRRVPRRRHLGCVQAPACCVCSSRSIWPCLATGPRASQRPVPGRAPTDSLPPLHRAQWWCCPCSWRSPASSVASSWRPPCKSSGWLSWTMSGEPQELFYTQRLLACTCFHTPVTGPSVPLALAPSAATSATATWGWR